MAAPRTPPERRFGSDKLLHPLTLRGATMPLAAHSLLPWLETFALVTVVVRPGAEAFCSEIETALARSKPGTRKSTQINWIVCADAAQGMAASLGCGVRANRDAAAWLIGLADQPAVPGAAIAGICNALQAGAGPAAPSRDGRRGHPVGFACGYRDELLALHGDAGARRLLERDRSKIVEININDAGIFSDINTPGDLRHL